MTSVRSSVQLKYIALGVIVGILGLGVLVAQAATTASILPTVDGAFTSWTPSTGTSHFANVDESSCNGVTDYNSTTVVGNRDSYSVSLSPVPNGATVTTISITPCASNNTSGGTSSTFKVFYRYNGANSADGSAYTLSGITPTGLASTNFSSLSFVKGSTSTLEIGGVLSAGTKGARLSRMAVVITYSVSPVAPSATTTAASLITASSSRLNGTVNPNGATTTVWFRYSTTNPGSCSDAFGVTTGTTILGVGASSTAFGANISGLTSNTTYYFCVLASNVVGTTTGSVLSFITNDIPPTAPSALVATGVSTSQVDLSWTDNSSNEIVFNIERSTSSAAGPFFRIASSSANIATYSDTGRSASTTYWYRVNAQNLWGTSAYSAVAAGSTL